MTDIAFIGLGNMGGPMAANLLKAGHALRVFDLDAAAVQALVDAGAQGAAGSPREAAGDVECVITMLPAAAHVRHVIGAEDGVLAGIAPGVTIVDCSTIDPATVKAMAQAAEARGNRFVDAPVSGGTGGAAAGTLTFMVGAQGAQFEALKPLLAAMGRNIIDCGGVSMGQVAKICNNLLLGISMAGVSEAMALGEALGIDPKVLAGIVDTFDRTLLELGYLQPVPGRGGDGAGLARLYRRFRHRPDVEGPGARHRCREVGTAAGLSRLARAAVVPGA